MYITINKLREHDADNELLESLSKTYADDAPIKIVDIFASNGLDDALYCLRAVDGYDKEIRLYAVWCARQVQHLLTDKRSLAALDVAERHAYGQASDEELKAAWESVGAAAWAAARGAAGAARDAAWEAAWAALAAAGAAALAAAGAAAGAAAREAARAAAGAAAREAMRTAQAARLCEVCKLIEAKHEHNDR